MSRQAVVAGQRVIADSDEGSAQEGRAVLHQGHSHSSWHATPGPPATPAAGSRARSPVPVATVRHGS